MQRLRFSPPNRPPALLRPVPLRRCTLLSYTPNVSAYYVRAEISSCPLWLPTGLPPRSPRPNPISRPPTRPSIKSGKEYILFIPRQREGAAIRFRPLPNRDLKPRNRISFSFLPRIYPAFRMQDIFYTPFNSPPSPPPPIPAGCERFTRARKLLYSSSCRPPRGGRRPRRTVGGGSGAAVDWDTSGQRPTSPDYKQDEADAVGGRANKLKRLSPEL